MTYSPKQVQEEDQLVDALQAAGVELDRMEIPDDEYDVAGALYTRVEPFRALRPDLGQFLSFDLSESLEGEEPEGWLWWVCEDEGGGVDDGWEPDLDSMVRVVVEFLKAGAPAR